MQDQRAEAPFISVVTPFYNNEHELAECIKSVLAQTRSDFEYVIADNCSSDGSAEIARRYATRDGRIRLVTNDSHLSQVDNYNRALSAISPSSEYCKIVQADDWLFPECLDRMVSLAESEPKIGLVSSYYLSGTEVKACGLPVGTSVFAGSDVGRKQFLDHSFFFGTPTTVLYRASIVRSRQPFYDTTALHEDTDVCYRILANWDLGFVHQILSYDRVTEDSITGAVADLNPHALDWLIMYRRHGRAFLNDEELHRCVRAQDWDYCRNYVRSFVRSGGRRYRRYHKDALRDEGYRVPVGLLAGAAGFELLRALVNPGNTVRDIVRRFRAGRGGR